MTISDAALYYCAGEIHTILSAEDGHESRIQNRECMQPSPLSATDPFHNLPVENELNVFKKACFSSEAEKKTLTEEVAALREKVEQLESEKNVRARVQATTNHYVCH